MPTDNVVPVQSCLVSVDSIYVEVRNVPGTLRRVWKEVVESDQKVGGEEDDPAASVEPYLDAEWESYYRYLLNVSLAPKDGFSPSAKLAVTRLLLKPEEVESFIAAAIKNRKTP